MSTTSNPRPAVASSATATPAYTPSVAAPRSNVHDYRANVDRQSREQKSVGNILSFIVYGLVAIFVLGAILAAYGGYAITRQIHQQSLTISDLDSRYGAANQALSAQLKASNDSLTQALTQTQAQITRQEALLVRQQDTINKLSSDADADVAALRQERTARSTEAATLRARLRLLEEQNRSGVSRQQ